QPSVPFGPRVELGGLAVLAHPSRVIVEAGPRRRLVKAGAEVVAAAVFDLPQQPFGVVALPGQEVAQGQLVELGERGILRGEPAGDRERPAASFVPARPQAAHERLETRLLLVLSRRRAAARGESLLPLTFVEEAFLGISAQDGLGPFGRAV